MLNLAKQAYLININIRNKHKQAMCFENMGLGYGFIGDYKRAFKYFNNALRFYKETGDRMSEAYCLNNIGGIYSYQGEYARAIIYYKKSLAIKKTINDQFGQAYCLNNLGGVYDYLGNYPQALEHYLLSLKMRKKIGERQGQANCLNNIGLVYIYLGDYNKALEYFNEALTIQKEVGDKRGESFSLNNLGIVYKSRGDYAKALDYFNEALKIREKIGDKRAQAYTLNEIGSLYITIKKFDKARESLLKVEKIARELGEKEVLRRFFISWSELLIAEDKYTNLRTAENYVARALKITEILRSKPGYATAILLRARIGTIKIQWIFSTNSMRFKEIFHRKWRSIQSDFKKAIKIFNELGRQFDLATAYYYYAEVLSTMSHIIHSKKQLVFREKTIKAYRQKAKELFEKIGAEDYYRGLLSNCDQKKL